MKKINEKSEVKNEFRYVCDACTNVAFVSTIVTAGEGRTCRSCGKIFVTKKENFIKI